MPEVYFICPNSECKFQGYALLGTECPKCGKTNVEAIDGRGIKSYSCPKCHKRYQSSVPFCPTDKVPCTPIYR